MPSWMGEVAAFAQVLTHEASLKTIQEQVRFARARFGQYDLIDFVVVLIGYTISGEADLEGFLRTTCPFCRAVHGPLWSQPVAPSLNPVPFSCCP